MPTKKTHIGHESFLRLPLFDANGTVLSPTVSLDMALSEGPIPETHLLQLASEYDDPNIVPTTLAKLGAIRVRQDDGTVVVTLPHEQDFKFAVMPGATDADGEGYPIPPTQDTGGDRVVTAEGSAALAVGFADRRSSALDDYFDAGGDLVPWKEATKQGASIGDMSIVHRGDQRFVRQADLDAFLSKRRRGSPTGAAANVQDAIGRAQRQRAADSKAPATAAARGRQAGREYRKLKSEQIVRQTRPL